MAASVFPKISDSLRAERLSLPTRRSTVILDTDIANEIDDPFAIAHAVLSPEQIDLRAITTVPFRRDGLSALDTLVLDEEMGKATLGSLGRLDIPLIRGSARFFEDASDAVESDAVDAIIAAAEGADPLYLLAIGAATNVASALLKRPDLVEKIVVVWLGGHTPGYGTAWEYNLMGDIHASRVLVDSGVPLVLFPAMGVTSHLLVSLAALEADLEGKSACGTYLTSLVRGYSTNHFGWEKELWDVGVTSYLVNPDWTPSTVEPTPGISESVHWTARPLAPVYRRATYVNRNAILGDLFRKIVSCGV